MGSEFQRHYVTVGEEVRSHGDLDLFKRAGKVGGDLGVLGRDIRGEGDWKEHVPGGLMWHTQDGCSVWV